MMLAGLGLLVLGMGLGGFFPSYPVLLGALFLAGLGKAIFDPALQAFIGRHVPYHRRALAIGLVEFSWAGSALLGLPLMGLLIERIDWRAPFWALGALGLAGMIALRRLLPANDGEPAQRPPCISPWSAWRTLGREKAARGALVYAFLISAANDNLFVVYGAWLEQAFGLSVLALGLGTGVIGVAELLGEGLTASMADRLGLKRSVLLGLSLSGLSYALLPLAEHSLSLALTGLFAIFVTLEFTIVTAISLFTELQPGLRATMMSGYLAASSLGRIAGALTGGPLWLAGGIPAVALASTALSGLALAALFWGLRDWNHRPGPRPIDP